MVLLGFLGTLRKASKRHNQHSERLLDLNCHPSFSNHRITKTILMVASETQRCLS